MEPTIQTELPSGSPLLGYGESAASPSTRKLRLLLAAILSLVFFGIGSWFFLKLPIPLPNQPIAILGQTPSASLPASVPELWKSTKQQANRIQVFGFALTENGMEPFVLGIRQKNTPGTYSQFSNLFQLQSDVKLPTTPIPLYRTLPLLFNVLRHGSYLRITAPEQFVTTSSFSLEGPINGSSWDTHFPLATPVVRPSLPEDQLRLNLLAFPNAWGSIKDAVSRSLFPLTFEQLPTALGWTVGENGSFRLDLSFEGGPSSSTLLDLLSATGIYDTKVVQLPDGTLAEELRLPLSQLQQTSSTILDKDGTKSLTRSDGSVRIVIGDLSKTLITVENTVSCGSTPPLMQISGPILEAVWRYLGIPSPNPYHALLIGTSKDQTVVICGF